MQNMSSQSPQTDAQATQIMRTLWLGLFASQFIIAFVAFKILPQDNSGVETINPQLFLGIGLMVLAASFVVPQVLMKSLNVPADKINVSVLFTPFILSLALNEACTMMGFLVKRTSGDDRMALLLFGISAVAFLVRYPSENKIQNQIENLKNQKAK